MTDIINLNRRATLRLTDLGVEILCASLDADLAHLEKAYDSLTPTVRLELQQTRERVARTKIASMPLWEVAYIFGSKLYMGAPPLFDLNVEVGR